MPKTSVARSAESRSLSSSPRDKLRSLSSSSRAICAIIALTILYICSSVYSESKSNLFCLVFYAGRKIYPGVGNILNNSKLLLVLLMSFIISSDII